jgi:hypothetical protein
MKKCKVCGFKIGIEDKAVLLHTFKNKQSIEKVYFHLNCWIQDLQDNVNRRVGERLNILKDQSMGLLGNVLKSIKVNQV